MRQLPPEWEALAESKGISASAREIGVAAGVATTTITRLVFDGRTSGETVRKVAAALGVEQAKVFELAKLASHSDLGPWDPPQEAHQLGAATRQALERLIVAMAKEGGRSDDGKSEDKKSPVARPKFGAGGKRDQIVDKGQSVKKAAREGEQPPE